MDVVRVRTGPATYQKSGADVTNADVLGLNRSLGYVPAGVWGDVFPSGSMKGSSSISRAAR